MNTQKPGRFEAYDERIAAQRAEVAHQKGVDDAHSLIAAVRTEIEHVAERMGAEFRGHVPVDLLVREISVRLLRDGWRRP